MWHSPEEHLQEEELCQDTIQACVVNVCTYFMIVGALVWSRSDSSERPRIHNAVEGTVVGAVKAQRKHFSFQSGGVKHDPCATMRHPSNDITKLFLRKNYMKFEGEPMVTNGLSRNP
mmetsp:Transcript_1600/g.2196  ORF Transcript_1600/g.2196 Transcript_1600/m.2196 type:complete len:117 (-) Transcript_1600:233-583(-)